MHPMFAFEDDMEMMLWLECCIINLDSIMQFLHHAGVGQVVAFGIIREMV